MTSNPSDEPAKHVFLSSTSRDLAEHREKVIRRCSIFGYTFTVMEEFGAQDGDASHVSIREVKNCDVFLGAYAHRYGFVPRGTATSVTELEYDEAARLQKPRLLFAVAPGYDGHPLLEQHRDDRDAGSNAGLTLGTIGRTKRLYTSLAREGAIAEIAYHWSQYTPRPSKPAMLHTLRVSAQHALRLVRTDLAAPRLHSSALTNDSPENPKT